MRNNVLASDKSMGVILNQDMINNLAEWQNGPINGFKLFVFGQGFHNSTDDVMNNLMHSNVDTTVIFFK